jgi:hypothetical protein
MVMNNELSAFVVCVRTSLEAFMWGQRTICYSDEERAVSSPGEKDGSSSLNKSGDAMRCEPIEAGIG